MIHPAAAYFFATPFLPLFKQKKVKQIFLLIIPLFVLIQIFFLKPQTTQLWHIFGFKLFLLQSDKLNLFFAYIFSLIALPVMLYSFQVQSNIHFILSFLYVGSALGALFAGDYLTFFIFFELMTLSSTFLIWSNRQEESLKAGYRYLVYHFIAGLFLLGGIAIEYINIYLTKGDWSAIPIGPLTTELSSIFILIGIGLNAAFIPFHTWLPDAYPKASFPASVLMSVYTTKTAVYALARIFPGVNLLVYMGALMAIYGVTLALMQNEMRKLLSYHIISQVGYMVAAIGLGGDLGVNGGLFHAFNNILYKSLLFMCAGAVIYHLGEERLSELGGLAKKMPLTTLTCLIASFSIAGLPFFNGYISKTIISEVAHQTRNYAICLILKLATIGTWLSFLKLTYFGFLRKTMQTDSSGFKQIKEVPWNMSLPMFIVALLCFFTGIYPKLIISILPYPLKEMHFYSSPRLFSAPQIYLTVLIIFFLLKKYFAPRKVIILDLDYFYKKLIHFLSLVCKVITKIDAAYTGVIVIRLSKKVVSLFIRLCKNIAKFDAIYTLDIERLIPYARETTLISVEEGYPERIITNGNGLIVRSSERLALFDREIIDGTVNRVGSLAISVGKKLRRIQTGYVQNYAAVMFFLLLVILTFYLIFF